MAGGFYDLIDLTGLSLSTEGDIEAAESGIPNMWIRDYPYRIGCWVLALAGAWYALGLRLGRLD